MSSLFPPAKVFVAIRPVFDEPLYSLRAVSRGTAATSDVSGLLGLSVAALSHWIVVVLPASSEIGLGEYYIFELTNPHDAVASLSAERNTAWSDTVVQACHGRVVGSTLNSYAQTEAVANDLINNWGDYDVLRNNCQKFVVKLINEICADRVRGWFFVAFAGPRYKARFPFSLGKDPAEDQASDLPSHFADLVRPATKFDPELTAKYMFSPDFTQAPREGFLEVNQSTVLQNVHPAKRMGWGVAQVSDTREWGIIQLGGIEQIDQQYIARE
ncbi:hypothetical protein C8R46DRAFT_1184966 [Mycena filopes]|nr:hypothetical protein C8R46DRAFT_1184966 [Mycena filopes]